VGEQWTQGMNRWGQRGQGQR